MAQDNQVVVIRCDFPDTHRYHAKYQRNNKRTGLKNLRCYPYCGTSLFALSPKANKTAGPDEKHHENGFCGAAVRINISSTQYNGTYSVDRLCAWGEFTSQTHATISGGGGAAVQAPKHRFPIGSVFSQQEVNDILRTDGMHLNPLFEASSNDSAFPQYRQFSFESQKKGWHYDWKGNKYTSDLPHAFTIYVAAPLENGKFHCLAVFSSPEFTMFCRRRHKTVSEAEKTQMATAVDEASLRIEHVLNSDGRITISSSSVGLLQVPPPPPPLPAAAAAPKKKRASSASTGSSPGKRTKQQLLPKQEPMSPLSQIPPPPPPLPIAMMSMHHHLTQLPISPCNSMPPTPLYINSTPNGVGGAKFEFTDAGTPATLTPISDVKLKTILAAIQNLDKLRKLNQNKVTSREEAEELFNSFEKLDGNWIDAIFSGPFNDQGLLDDFNSSLRDVSTDAFLLNLGEVDLGQIIQVLEALGKHLVEEDRFTDTIYETARTSTMTFADCMLLISNEVQSFLLAEFQMTVDHFYSSLSGHASTAVDLNPEERNQAMKSAFDTLVQAATSNQATFSSSSSSASSPPVIASAAAAASSTTVSTPLTQFEIQFPPGVTFEDFLREPHANTDFEHFPDVTGYWVRPEANKLDMERWRERREMDWVSRQMIGKMEERFGMLSQPLTNSVAVSLGRKLLSTGALTYVLDAVERPFPMHGPLGPTLAKKMIGWAVGPCVLFRNAYSDTERLIRVNWKVGEDELHGMHIYQSKNDEGYGQAPVEFVTADGWKVVHIAKYICDRDLTKD